MKKMKLEDKLMVPFAIFLTSLIIVSILFINFANLTKENYEDILHSDTRFNKETNILTYYNLIRETSFSNFQKNGQQKDIEKYHDYIRKSDELYLRMFNDISNTKIKSNLQDQYALFKQINVIEKDILDGIAPASILQGQEYLSLKEEFGTLADFPIEFHEFQVKANLVKNINDVQKNKIILLSLILLTVAVIVIEFFMIKKDIIDPMNDISKALSEVEKGKFNIKIEKKSATDMGLLAKKLSSSAEAIKARIDKSRKFATLNKKKNVQLKKEVSNLHHEKDNLTNMAKLAMVVFKDRKNK